jgi:trk system potassium uptake protein TrkH
MAILLVLGTVVFLFSEEKTPSHTLGQFVAISFFNSVSPRTAGFAAVNYMQMSYTGVAMTILLMFIGGNSGSTAGGLKTTTVAVLFIRVWNILNGRRHTRAFGRTLPRTIVAQAFSVFFIYTMLIAVSVFVLLSTQPLPKDGGLEIVVFEVVSAIATVGNTMGLTNDLNSLGKIVLVVLMYIGRVGIVTILFSISEHAKYKDLNIKYPEENILIT